MKLKKKLFPFILLFIWVLVIIIVNPIREFPLNDDWAFSRVVYDLTQNGIFRMDPWIGVTLLSHLLWGSSFVYLFGFSFTVLRFSTLIMGLTGILVSYKLLSELLKDKGKAFILSLFIVFNPLYLHLSFTYMTDLSFYVFVILSNYFYIHSFRKGDRFSAYAGTFFALLATLDRQIALFLPLSVLIIRFIYWKKDWKIILKYTLHFIFVAGILSLYVFWLKETGNKPVAYRQLDELFIGQSIVKHVLERTYRHLGDWFNDFGLWFFPILVLLTVSTWKRFKRFLKPAGIFTILASVVIFVQNIKFPLGNIFYFFGLGPMTLTDHFIYGMGQSLPSSNIVYWIIRIIAFTGGIMFAWLISCNIIESIGKLKQNFDPTAIVKILFALQILIFNAVLLVSFTFFDRYEMAFLVPTLLLVIPWDLEVNWQKAGSWIIISVFVIVMGFFSIAATRDYLAWNQARWDVAKELVDSGISPQQIDGGFEYNGWNGVSFDKFGKWNPDQFEYVLSFTPMDDYEIFMKRPYNHHFALVSRIVTVVSEILLMFEYISEDDKINFKELCS